MSVVDKIFNRYKHLPLYYADKVYNSHRISFDRDDVIQELNIRLYKGIVSYGKKWKAYRQTGKYKPVPIVYYLKFCMINRVRDMIKMITKQSHRISYHAEFTFDVGVSTTSFVDFDKNKFIVNDVNIMSRLTDNNHRRIFRMFLKGYTIATIKKLFKGKNVDVSYVIRTHIEYLSRQKHVLMQNNPVYFVSTTEE